MKLGEFLKYQKGKVPTAKLSGDNRVLYLSPEYLRGKSGPNYVQDFSGRIDVDETDVLLLWDGSNAGEFFKGKPGALTSTMVRLVYDPDEFNHQFLFYQMKSIEWILKSQTHGSGIPHVDKKVLLSIDVGKFAPTEQKKIADILSSLDKTISHTKALIAKEERIKIGLMQDLLSKGIDKDGNIRSVETHEFRDSPLGRIPKEWGDDVLQKGISYISDYRGKTPPYTDHGIPVISAERVHDGELRSPRKFVTEETYKQWLTRQVPQGGDVILTVEAPVGEVALFPADGRNLLTRRVIAFNCDEDKLHNLFLYYWFLRMSLEGSWTKYSRESTVPRVLKPDITGSPMVFPPPAEQQSIAAILENQKSSIMELEAKRKKFTTLKKGLLQDLMEGRVDVSSINHRADQAL